MGARVRDVLRKRQQDVYARQVSLSTLALVFTMTASGQSKSCDASCVFVFHTSVKQRTLMHVRHTSLAVTGEEAPPFKGPSLAHG